MNYLKQIASSPFPKSICYHCDLNIILFLISSSKFFLIVFLIIFTRELKLQKQKMNHIVSTRIALLMVVITFNIYVYKKNENSENENIQP